jgi:hypothetical protein
MPWVLLGIVLGVILTLTTTKHHQSHVIGSRQVLTLPNATTLIGLK